MNITLDIISSDYYLFSQDKEDIATTVLDPISR